jgi:hypothetical protein
LLLAGVLACGCASEPVATPDVVALQLKAAVARLEATGLEFETVDDGGGERAVFAASNSTVVRQDPASGNPVAARGIFTLFVLKTLELGMADAEEDGGNSPPNPTDDPTRPLGPESGGRPGDATSRERWVGIVGGILGETADALNAMANACLLLELRQIPPSDFVLVAMFKRIDIQEGVLALEGVEPPPDEFADVHVDLCEAQLAYAAASTASIGCVDTGDIDSCRDADVLLGGAQVALAQVVAGVLDAVADQ